MSAQTIDLDALRQIFVDECYDGLDSVAESLIELETNPDHPDARAAIFRVAHTVKGGASIVGFTCVAEYAHLFEDALESLRADTAPVTPLQVTLLLQATDALRAMIFAEASGREIVIRESDRTLLAHLAASSANRVANVVHAPRTEPVLGDVIAPLEHQAHARALRVDMDKLDTMLTLSGEIAVARRRLPVLLERRRELTQLRDVTGPRRANARPWAAPSSEATHTSSAVRVAWAASRIAPISR